MSISSQRGQSIENDLDCNTSCLLAFQAESSAKTALACASSLGVPVREVMSDLEEAFDRQQTAIAAVENALRQAKLCVPASIPMGDVRLGLGKFDKTWKLYIEREGQKHLLSQTNQADRELASNHLDELFEEILDALDARTEATVQSAERYEHFAALILEGK